MYTYISAHIYVRSSFTKYEIIFKAHKSYWIYECQRVQQQQQQRTYLPTDDGEISLRRILEQLQYGGDQAVGPGQAPGGEDGEEEGLAQVG